MSKANDKKVEQGRQLVDSSIAINGRVAGQVDMLATMVDDKHITSGFESRVLELASETSTGRSKKGRKAAGHKDGDKLVFNQLVSDEVMGVRALLAKIETDGQNWTFKLGWDGKSGNFNACHVQRTVSPIAGKKETSTDTTTLAELLNKAVRLYGYEDTLMSLVTIGQAIKDSATANKAKKA